jgi:hypothetical protein
MPTTKNAILAAYREQLKSYPWAADEAKLDRFMSAALNTLTPGAGEGEVDRTGHSWLRALERNGIYGKNQALKRLRILPD